MKLTEIFGKQVYSIYEGEIVGTVCDAIFNQTKLISFKLFDKDEHEYKLSLNNIKALSDCIVINNKNKLEYFLENSKTTPMFKIVIDENGICCGKIIDAEIDKDGAIEKFITDKKIELLPNEITTRKDFVFFSTRPIKINKLKPKNTVSPTNIKVNILKSDEGPKDNFTPIKLQYNSANIIGKVAKCDLYGINKEIIIKAGYVISEKTISDASRHNRLNQLFYIAV